MGLRMSALLFSPTYFVLCQVKVAVITKASSSAPELRNGY